MMKFSVIIPFKDSPKERKFALKTIPAAIALEPDEILIGTDKPADEGFLDFVKELAKRESFESLHVVETPRSPDWGFQLAHVIWDCYNKCRNDAILLSNVDDMLRPAVLAGLEHLQRDNAALVYFSLKMLVNGPRTFMRYWLDRRYKPENHPSSAIFWVDRPQMLEDVRLSDLKRMENAIDVYIVNSIMTNKTRKITYVKDFAADSLDVTNPDLPWRQFQVGIYQYASLDRVQRERLARIMDSHASRRRRWKWKIIYRFPWIRVLWMSFTTLRPNIIRGYLWARRHETHIAVTTAKEMSDLEYMMTGARYIKDIRQWDEHNAGGTGFR